MSNFKAYDNRKELTIGHSLYAGMSSAEARRRIKVLLDNMMFVVSPENNTKESIYNYIGDEPLPKKVSGKAINQGLVEVTAYVDDSNDTYEVISGNPVAFDTVSGIAVTGINPTWSSDEYKIIGTAWGSHKLGFGKVPVMLGATAAAHTNFRFVRTKSHIVAGTYQLAQAEVFVQSSESSIPQQSDGLEIEVHVPFPLGELAVPSNTMGVAFKDSISGIWNLLISSTCLVLASELE